MNGAAAQVSTARTQSWTSDQSTFSRGDHEPIPVGSTKSFSRRGISCRAARRGGCARSGAAQVRLWSLLAPRKILRIDPPPLGRYFPAMHAIEFTTELSDSRMLPIPQEVADQLPKTGRARIIVLTDELTGDAEWRLGAYQQFLRDDSPEDAIYDSCR